MKNKIVSISKELDLVSKENSSLKNDLSSHFYLISSAPSISDKHVACSTSSSIIENDICALKMSVHCLGLIVHIFCILFITLLHLSCNKSASFFVLNVYFVEDNNEEKED